MFRETFSRVFQTEDEPMIARVEENMEAAEFWSLRPIFLPGDEASTRARRIIEKLIKQESGAAPASEPELEMASVAAE